MAIDKIFNDDSLDGVADSVFSSVNTSIFDIKAMQQRKVAENVQVVIKALKKIESNLQDRYDGITTTLEKKAASIKDGKDGQNGVDGRAGKDGRPGRDGAVGPRGANGLDGRNGRDGVDGVSVTNANIDFDGSLIISLSNGRTINVGEVVAPDLAERIKVITNGGGTSQGVLDAIAALQATIATYGTMALQNASAVAITGGAINGTTIGATTPSTGAFTTLTENASPVVVQTDIGTAPNEIPLNQYLGNLAYQDASSIAGPVGVGGNLTVRGSQVVFAPAPATIATTSTLTNADILTKIIIASGASDYTITLPLGTTLETLVAWAGVDLAYDFTFIPTGGALVTLGANTGVTIVGEPTFSQFGGSVTFRIRRTAANTFIVYNIG